MSFCACHLILRTAKALIKTVGIIYGDIDSGQLDAVKSVDGVESVVIN